MASGQAPRPRTQLQNKAFESIKGKTGTRAKVAWIYTDYWTKLWLGIIVLEGLGCTGQKLLCAGESFPPAIPPPPPPSGIRPILEAGQSAWECEIRLWAWLMWCSIPIAWLNLKKRKREGGKNPEMSAAGEGNNFLWEEGGHKAQTVFSSAGAV